MIYRVCVEFIICSYDDYYIWIHLAPGNSSNNEVERILSSVGDVVCDGGYLDFDHYGQFEDIGEEELENMSAKDLESHEWSRMGKNAKKGCDEVSRVDGAPPIEGFMKSHVSKDHGDLFFWDMAHLRSYLKASEEKRKDMSQWPQ